MRFAALLIAITSLLSAPNRTSGHAPVAARDAGTTAPTVIGPVIVRSGSFFFGGRYLAPPCTLSYRDDVLVVNGLRLREPRPPQRAPITPSSLESPKQRLRQEAGRIFSEARQEGCSDSEIYARLGRFYRASEFVDVVDVGPGHLAITYRGRSRPVRIVLPRPSGLSPEERREKRRRDRQRELEFLKSVLEEGGVVLHTPTGRVTIPWHRAGEALQAIEAYQRDGRTQGFSEFIAPDLWHYLQTPVTESAR